MSIHIPTFRRQIGDPTTWLDSYICTLEASAMGLDYQTGGEVSVWGGELVPYCGKTASQIIDRGTNLQNAALAFRHFGELLDIRGDEWDEAASWTTVVRELDKGNAIILQGDYDVFTLEERCQDSFTGGHAEILIPIWSGDEQSILTGDPLCGGYKYVRLSSLRRYAEKLAFQQRGTVNRLFFAVVEASIIVPDTDTEEPEMPGLGVRKIADATGVATVKADSQHYLIRVRDLASIKVAANEKREVICEAALIDPLEAQRGKPPVPGDRTNGYLVGKRVQDPNNIELGFLLRSDVTFAPAASDFNSGVDAAAKEALTAKR